MLRSCEAVRGIPLGKTGREVFVGFKYTLA